MGSPVYIQIHDEIHEAIDAGRWVPGDRIPAERELADQFSVSRMTLRQAIMLLVDEGVLERRVGSGTFVSEQKVQEHLNGITSFTDLMADAGKQATSKTVSFHVGRATNSEQEQLQLSSDARVLRMERVRYGDDEPIAFEVAAIPESLIEGLSRSDLTDSLYRTLAEERGLKIGRAQQTVTAAAVNERISEYLAIKRGDPVLVLRQITYDTKGTPFEYVQTQYVGSRFEFYMEKS